MSKLLSGEAEAFAKSQNIVGPEKNFFLDPKAQNLREGILRQSGRGGEIVVLMVGICAREGRKAPYFGLGRFFLS